MRQVRHLLDVKGRAVYSARPDETVFRALERMAEHGVGSLVVVDNGDLIGVISERDYARKVVLKHRSSADTPVSEVMSAPVLSVGLDASVDECMHLCTERRVRHLPVVEDGALVGLVSIGDLVKA
ncbi:MAG TPA: CBS domain-containing protein, partial [Rhodanobacteraceae bacterium]|nr:CBS domain-containing protein [Rhodanobacteraceae bacterium]